MLYPGYSVPPFYDSMLAKIIVWDQDRAAVLRRLRRALQETEIGGLKTTLPLHLALVDDAAVQQAQYHTAWLEGWLETLAPPP